MKYTIEDYCKWQNLYDTGLSIKATAEKLGVSTNSIRRHVNTRPPEVLKFIELKCGSCNVKFKVNKVRLRPSKSGKHFCSASCSASYNNPLREVRLRNCVECSKPLKLSSRKYCSVECKNKYSYSQYIKSWKSGLKNGMSGKHSISHYIRKYLFIKYGSRCLQCGWTGLNSYSNKIPLEIDHIDGNYKNNSESNLRLLCPNCHSLTSTYKSLNKGKGRKERK